MTKRSTPEAPEPSASNTTTPTNITTTSEQQNATTKETMNNITASAPQVRSNNDTLSVTFPTDGVPSVSGNTSNVIITNNETSSTKRSNETSTSVSDNNVNNQSSITTKAATKKSNLKTMDVRYRSNDLPPVYLTVKNGRKMLVVHPTAEFLSSLPRINFTESYADKRAVGTPVRTSLVKHAEVAKAPEARNEIPNKEENSEEEEVDDESEDEGDNNEEEVDKNENKEEMKVEKRSNIAYVDVPVISPDPDGPLDRWMREHTQGMESRSKLYRRDLTKNFDPRELNRELNPSAKDFDPMSNTQNLEAPPTNPLTGQNFPGEEFQGLNVPSPAQMDQSAGSIEGGQQQKPKPFFQQTHDSLPLPNEIQSLYKEYASQGKSNFQYEPSRDEVAEELQFAQKQSANNQLGGKDHIQGLQATSSDMRGGHDMSSGMEGGGLHVPSQGASRHVEGQREALWDGQGLQETEGSKRTMKTSS